MSNYDEKKSGFSSFDQAYIEINEVNNQEIYISRGKRQIVNQEVDLVTKEKEVEKPKNKEKNYGFSPLQEITQEESVFKAKRLPISEPIQPVFEETIEVEMTNHQQPQPGLNKRKPFKQLTIEEKISYLQNYPSVLPPVSCFYQLDTTTLQGKLEEVNDTHIVIIQKDQTKKNIEKHSIRNILLPGLG